MPLNKTFPESDEYTELDHLYEVEALKDDLLRDEMPEPEPEWDENWFRQYKEAIERDDFKEERRKMNKEKTHSMRARVPIWVTRPQKELLNRFFKKQKPRAGREVWRDIANALVVSRLRTSDDIKQMLDLCEQGEINKDLYFTDVLRTEFRKGG